MRSFSTFMFIRYISNSIQISLSQYSLERKLTKVYSSTCIKTKSLIVQSCKRLITISIYILIFHIFSTENLIHKKKNKTIIKYIWNIPLVFTNRWHKLIETYRVINQQQIISRNFGRWKSAGTQDKKNRGLRRTIKLIIKKRCRWNNTKSSNTNSRFQGPS